MRKAIDPQKGVPQFRSNNNSEMIDPENKVLISGQLRGSNN